MKSIITIISALLFISSSVFIDMSLSDGNKHVPVVINQHVYEPGSAHLCNEKTESLPLDGCNCEKQLEGSHVVNSRFGSVRKVFSRQTFFTPLSFLSKRSATVVPIPNKAQAKYVTYTENNLPLHIRNCIWLI